MKRIWLDMDGTVADLYKVDGWLDCLLESDTHPYEVAAPINITDADIQKLHEMGFSVGVISWGAKSSSNQFLKDTKKAKLQWVRDNLPSIDGPIHVVHFGTPKHRFKSMGDILVDDEESNRNAWGDNAMSPDDLVRMVA